MLVLSRKKNETITIGDNIIITVVELRGDKCRIGISAPKDVPVHRTEVFEAIKSAGGDMLAAVKKSDVPAAGDVMLPPRE